jgi:hypothetical protein
MVAHIIKAAFSGAGGTRRQVAPRIATFLREDVA